MVISQKESLVRTGDLGESPRKQCWSAGGTLPFDEAAREPSPSLPICSWVLLQWRCLTLEPERPVAPTRLYESSAEEGRAISLRELSSDSNAS